MSRGVYKILTLLLISITGVAFQSNNATAITSGQTVELSVPSTSLQVNGSSARQALVTIELNDIVVASTTSDNDGAFNYIIASVPSGLQKISVQYEVNGRKALKQIKNVSLQPQQLTVVDFLLPPILFNAGAPETSVSQNIVLEGYSVPNSTVTLQSSTGFSLQTVTNQTGQYIFSVSGGQFFLPNVTFTSLYQINNQSSALSNSVSVIIRGLETQENNNQSEPGGSGPDILVNPLQPTTPVIIYPEGNQLTLDVDSILFRGRAQSGTQIIAYANGQIVGSVVVNQNGEWEFYYTSTEERVIFQFSACKSQSCSLPSQSVELQFSVILGECNIDLRLDNYRFLDVTTKDYVILNTDTFPVDLEVYIDWGDGPTEMFSYDAGSQFQYRHMYGQSGVYNGSVRVAFENCSQERFFSVIVNEHSSAMSTSRTEIINMMIILGILLLVGFYVRRSAQR